MKLSAVLTVAASVLLAGGAWAESGVKDSSTPDASNAPTTPSEKYLLHYKFAMGEVLRYQVKHTSNVRTTIDTTTQQVETLSDSVKAWKVTDVLPTGEMDFVDVIEWVRMTNESPGHPATVYDSRSDAKPPHGFEQASRAVGVPLSAIRMAPSGEVVSRQQKFPQAAPSPDAPITLQLPKDPIVVGEKWPRTYDVSVERQGGAKVQIRTRRLCQLREVQHGVAVIDVSYEILTPVDSYVQSQLIDRLSEGMVRFDIDRGRVVSQRHDVDRRVLGFAGKTSSMHFMSRLEEQLLAADEQARVHPALATLPK